MRVLQIEQQDVLPGAIKRKRGDCYPIFAFLLCFGFIAVG
jgi:hypothetical protein